MLAVARRLAAEFGFRRDERGAEVLRMRVHVSAFCSQGYRPVLKAIRAAAEREVAELAGPERRHVRLIYTGVAPVIERIQQQLLSDLGSSLMAAAAVISVVMTLILAGVLPGLLVMLPNVFPIVVALGFLAVVGIPLDIGSVMTASVALGVAVDDTLHFVSYFQRQTMSGQSLSEAVSAAWDHCGAAMLKTSLICGLGMLVFGFSEFVPTSRFAWLTALMIALALVGDLLLLPALLLGPLGRFFLPGPIQSEPPRSSGQGQTPGAGKDAGLQQPLADAG
jgi:hypothetical protein